MGRFTDKTVSILKANKTENYSKPTRTKNVNYGKKNQDREDKKISNYFEKKEKEKN